MTLNPKLDPSCVLCLPWGETPGGNTAYDQSQYGNNGTIYGAVRTNGKPRWALSFDGNDYVEVPHNDVFNSANVAVSAWFKRTGSFGMPWIPLVGKWPRNWILYFKSDDRLYFIVKNPNCDEPYAVSTTIFGSSNSNIWYHVVGTYDGSNIKIYINGKLEGITPYSVGIAMGDDPVTIGRDQTSANFFTGLIGEVRIYTRALTDKEIYELYVYGVQKLRQPKFPEYRRQLRRKLWGF